MNAGELLTRGKRFIDQELWSLDTHPRSLRGALFGMLQFGVMVVEGFVRDQLLLRASALTTMAMLSLVPLIALMLSIVQALGVSENLAALVVEQVAPWSEDLRTLLQSLVEDVKLGALGTLGATTLMLTTVLALRHGEQTLNDIWGVVEGRSWTRRFADYLAVLVVAPVSMAVAISLRTTLESDPIVSSLLSYPAFEFLYATGLRQAPMVLQAFAFTFLYWFLPNTHVRFGSALIGGIVAAILLTIAQQLYIDFSVNAARTSVIFGTLAQVPLLITWIYFAMAIGLLGAEVSFAFQNLARYRREVKASDLEAGEREVLAVCVTLEVARAFQTHREPWDAAAIAERLAVPVRTVRDLLKRLERRSIVRSLAFGDRDPGYVLGRPAEHIRIGEVLAAIRGETRLPRAGNETADSLRSVGSLFADIERAVLAAGGERSLADLLGAEDERGGASPGEAEEEASDAPRLTPVPELPR